MLASALCGCLSGSVSPTGSASPTSSGSSLVSWSPTAPDIDEIDVRARYPQQNDKLVDATTSAGNPTAQIYYGDNSSPIASIPASQQRVDNDPGTTGALAMRSNGIVDSGGNGILDSGGYELNFENTPIDTVAKTVLGDILHVGYTIDPRVQGNVTLSSGRSVPRRDVLYVLETALRVSNVALVRQGTAYRLVPAVDAAGTGTMDRADALEAGYGITVVPLQFVSAGTLVKILDNFAAKPGMIRADPSRNLIVIQGNAADRQATLDSVHGLDADWLRGQSVGIFPVSNSTPEPIITELEKIVDAGDGGLSQNLVKLQPIARENAILAVTKKPELLKQIAMWVARLDNAGAAGTGVRVYHMRYGDAREVAGLLNNLFNGAADTDLDAPTNEFAPGSGTTSSTGGSPAAGASGQAANPASGTARFGGSPASSGSGGLATQLAANPGFSGISPNGVNRGGSLGGGNGQPILTNVRISPDVTNNSLLIYANQENFRIIQRTLEQLDRPQLQVAINATIAEVTLNDQLNYGVQFFLQSRNLSINNIPLPNNNNNNTTSGTGGALTNTLSQVLPGFNFLAGSQANPQLILDALNSVTSVKVLSTPSIVVVNNQPATLLVGDQIPITTQSAVSVLTPGAPIVNNIAYENTGVILHIIPRINVNGNVMLKVEQEISNVANNANAATLTPTVSQRIVKSSIVVANGQTVLLAGLISDTQNKSQNGIPGLDQIPGLGILFSQTTKSAQRDELIIFIRPQIIRNGSDAHRIVEELRAKMIGVPGPNGVSSCCIAK
jgi:general secretion pathway protein D